MHLRKGATVVLFVDPQRVKSDVQIGFSSIFWNTAWTGGQAPHTLGVLCEPEHPALVAFPTDDHSDWQWWSVVSRSRPMVLDGLTPALRPVVQVVPDWFQPQRLALVFEARADAGKLLVCSIDLDKDLETRLAARQLRYSLLRYAASDRFDPSTSIQVDALSELFREPTALQSLGATIQADSAHRSHPAANAMDGNVQTIWHSDWEPSPAPLPHSLVVDLKSLQSLAGLVCTPRQDLSNGRIAQYAVYVSQNGTDWGDAVASGTFPRGDRPQLVRFARTHAARFVKLAITREVNNRSFASLAEIDVLLERHP
jgi:hypothetical protein